MESKDANAIAHAIIELRRSVDNLNQIAKNVSKDVARKVHPSATEQTRPQYFDPFLLMTIPGKLSWTEPSIACEAKIRKFDDGAIEILIQVEGYDAGLVENLIHDMPVEALELIVVEPSRVRS